MPFITKGKTNLKYILVVVILAVIVGGGILWRQKMVQDETVRLGEFPEVVKTTKVDDESADWKTYRNEEYGFEIKYPQRLILTKPNF